MRVPRDIHRADLGGGSVAVLNTTAGRWAWLNEATDRVWRAAVDGEVLAVVEQFAGQGVAKAEPIVVETIAGLVREGLLTDGKGVAELPEQLPRLTRPATADARPGPAIRALAGLGLALALVVLKLPWRARLAVVNALRFLPAAPPALAASASAAVLQVRPSWWPGRIACMEVSLATVLTVALCGHRVHWVLGARRQPSEAHAWVWTGGGALGLTGRDAEDPRRPWMATAVFPALHPEG
jgi:hypothetical protein